VFIVFEKSSFSKILGACVADKNLSGLCCSQFSLSVGIEFFERLFILFSKVLFVEASNVISILLLLEFTGAFGKRGINLLSSLIYVFLRVFGGLFLDWYWLVVINIWR
jgi:hypothetical protein